MKKYDWELIRNEYVTSDVTLEELSTRPSYPALPTLKRRSTNEAWVDQRRQYRHQVQTKTREIATVTEAEISARQLRVARAMMGKALEALQALDPRKIPARDIGNLLWKGAELERIAVGMDTDNAEAVGELAKIARALENPIPSRDVN